MILEELAEVPDGALPVAELGDQLRLGSGFADDGAQDALLLAYLRAALSAVEGRTGKALFSRGFRWRASAWRDRLEQALPLAPVSAITTLELLPRGAAPVPIDPAQYVLIEDQDRPQLRPAGHLLPAIPTSGEVRIDFVAGYGPDWSDIPVDLRQAVLMLAAHYYAHRAGNGEGAAAMPTGVTAMIERYRVLRALGTGR